MSKQGYVIIVGKEKPATAIKGQWDQKLQKPKGETFEQVISVGKVLIMNQCRVWARRYYRDEKKNIIPVDLVEDKKYTGQLEHLPWGDELGHAIETRFIPQSRSLDVEFQEQREKLRIDKEKGIEGYVPQLSLNAGKNKFDPDKEPLLVQHLKGHAQNMNSPSKNPNPEIKGHQFFEENDRMDTEDSVKHNKIMFRAGTLIDEISANPAKMRNLFEVFGKRPEFGTVDHLDKDSTIFQVLLNFAKSNPEDVFSIIEAFKLKVQDLFEKFKIYDALKSEKDGTVAVIIDGKPHMIFDKAEGVGDQMVVWVLANIFEPEIYNKIKHLEQLASKLKK